MEHPLRYPLLESFPDTNFIEPVVREYYTGLSGADVFLARFNPLPGAPEKSGLKGIYLVKIEKKEDIDPDKFFHKISSTGRFSELIAPLRAISDSINGFVAVAYDVAFQDFDSPSLASILARQTDLSVKDVTRQIESLCSSLVDLHLSIDKTDNIDINEENRDRNTYYHVLYLMLEHRLSDIKNRLKKCLPDWPQETLHVTFKGRNILNPLKYVELDIWEKFKRVKHFNPAYYLAPVHSDLHAENIICYIPEAENKASTETDRPEKIESRTPSQLPKIIDFGQSKDNGIPFFDLAYLELDIIRRTLRVDNEEDCKQWFYLLDHIMAGKILPEGVPGKLNWDTQDRTLEFIYAIRRQVKRWLDEIEHREGAVFAASLKCVWWLATVAAGLNFARKGDDTEYQRPPQERKAALLYAAYGLASLYRQLDMAEEPINGPLPYVSWTSTTAAPHTETSERKQYLQAIPERKPERNELNLADLHIDENMVDNKTKWRLTQIFVWPNVLKQKLDHDVLQQQDPMSHKKTGRAKKERQSPVTPPESLATVLSREKQLLLLGYPGMGTSTILRYLLLQIIHQDAEFAARLPHLAGLVPVFIELNDYAHKIMQEHAEDVPITSSHHRLHDFISSYLQESYPKYRAYVEQQIQEGNVLFLFADLDAIADETLQQIIAQDITDYTYFHRENHFIVTSRPIAFRGTSLYNDYATYALTGFTEEQIKHFLMRWNLERNPQIEQVQAEVNRLWQVIHRDRAIRQLVTIPFYLTIFALRQSNSHNTPFGRNDFFVHCKELLLLCKGRKHEQGHLPQDILREIIYAIAFWMHEQDINNKQVSCDDLTGRIESLLKAHNGTVQPDAEPYINFMRKKIGILRQYSEEHFEFTLEPIKEYFAADYIAMQKRLEQSYRNIFIENHLHNSHWHEILRHVFAILLAGKNKTEEDVERAISDFRGRDMPLHYLIFIGQYMVDNPGHQYLEEEIILSIVYHYLLDDSDELRKKFTGFLRSSSETRLVKILKNILHHKPNSTPPAYRRNGMDPIAEYKGVIYECLGFVYTAQPTQREDAPVLRLRMMMLLTLFNMQNPDWSITTIELLNQPGANVAEKVKKAAIMLLGMLGRHDEQARERLLEALADPERPLRSVASNAVAQLARETRHDLNIPETLLTSLALTCSDEHKVALINTMALIGHVPATILDRLITEFPEARPCVQRAAVLATGEIARQLPDHAFNWTLIRDFLLQALAYDEEPEVKASAALAIDTLIKTLGDKDEVKQDKHVLISALLIALSDPDSQIKHNVRQALQRLGHPLLLDEEQE